MKSKSQEIRDALAAGDDVGALRIAAHFPVREYARLQARACNHPDFYRQLGQDPRKSADKAIALLKNNFLG